MWGGCVGVIDVNHSVCRGQHNSLGVLFLPPPCWERLFLLLWSVYQASCPFSSDQFCSLCFPSFCRIAGVTHALPHLVFYVGAGNRTQTDCALPPEPSLLLLRPFEKKLSCMKVSTLWFLALNCKICFILHKIKSRCSPGWSWTYYIVKTGLELFLTLLFPAGITGVCHQTRLQIALFWANTF